MRKLLSLSFLLTSLFSLSTAAQLEEIKLRLDQNIPRSRWFTDNNETLEGNSPQIRLKKIRKNLSEHKVQNCLEESRKLKDFPEIIHPWILVAELECTTEGVKNQGLKLSPPIAIFNKIEKNPLWLQQLPYGPLLEKNLFTLKIAILEKSTQADRKFAWKLVDDLFAQLPKLNKNQQALLFKSASELAFAQQNLIAARDYVIKSLELEPSKQLEDRLVTIENTLATSKLVRKEEKKSSDTDLEASEEELAIHKRILLAFQGGDLLSGVEDGVRLIRAYPGGRRAKWVNNKIIEALTGIIDKNDPNLASLQSKIIKQMRRTDAVRLYEWSKELYLRGYYDSAWELASESLRTLEESLLSTKVIYYAAKSAHATNRIADALSLYKQLIEKHAGSAESLEALFYVGLLEYKKEKYSNSIAYFEKLLALPEIDKWENSAHYWLWRAQQKNNSPQAKEQAEILKNKAPFSYYGIRAQAESQENKISLNINPETTNNMSSSVWLTPSQKHAWKRMELLLNAGWVDAASKELDLIPTPLEPKAKILFARYWASAFEYPKVIIALNQIWNDYENFRERRIVEIAFPMEATARINEEARKQQLHPLLIRSLIRQESAYDLDAVSRSQAYGLMQMIAPTAKEVATDLNVKSLQLPEDLFNAHTNIRFGAYYLNKMLRSFDWNVPLALAAYNAGPGRVKRWLDARSLSNNLASLKSSAPEIETWIDELPWDETRFYVKAILRNALIYKMLDQSPQTLEPLIWEFLLNKK